MYNRYMSLGESPSHAPEEQQIEIARRLFDLQKDQNDGRGVSCVRSIVWYIEHDDFESAKAVANTDFDKIRRYPEIAEYVQKHLLAAGM